MAEDTFSETVQKIATHLGTSPAWVSGELGDNWLEIDCEAPLLNQTDYVVLRELPATGPVDDPDDYFFEANYDVALSFGAGGVFTVSPVVGRWEQISNVMYYPGKPVAVFSVQAFHISELVEAVMKAKEKRFASRKNCSICNHPTWPEFMDGGRICMDCSSKHLGVVY